VPAGSQLPSNYQFNDGASRRRAAPGSQAGVLHNTSTAATFAQASEIPPVVNVCPRLQVLVVKRGVIGYNCAHA
jgi:hypothetical protein